MALEFAKELLGDAYTGELEEKLEAKINELYAPKADLDAASARADGLQEQLNAANEAIGKFEGLDAEQVKAQIAAMSVVSAISRAAATMPSATVWRRALRELSMMSR